jgi:hypothetical protein
VLAGVIESTVTLHFAHYNFVRIHKALRCTPAIAAGVTDKLSSVRELIQHSTAED